jgi:ribosomal protein S18 acetylase RimI-like enzyme
LITANHYLWSIVDPQLDCAIGAVWVQMRQRGTKRTAHVLNLIVYKQYRRMGFARQAMLRVEEWSRSQGLNEITLHVFGHNAAALELYKGLDFQITDVSMVKRLDVPK